MLVQMYQNSDMDLHSLSNVVIKKLLDEGVGGVVSDRLFFRKFMSTAPVHRIIYNNLHRTGGLSIKELSTLVSEVFEVSICGIEVGYDIIITHNDGGYPIYDSREFFIDGENFDFVADDCNDKVVEALCTDMGIIDYLYDDSGGRLVLSDGIIRAYPGNFITLDRIFKEVRRFMIRSEVRRDFRVTHFKIMLENEYGLFEVEEEELQWLI